MEVVQLVFPLAADLERVAEARGRDEARHRAFALDQRVGEERGGVDDPREVLGTEPTFGEQRGDARRHGAGWVLVGGENLAAPLASAVVIVDHDVGEGAPDVDPERMVRHGETLGPRRRKVKYSALENDKAAIDRERIAGVVLARVAGEVDGDAAKVVAHSLAPHRHARKYLAHEGASP